MGGVSDGAADPRTSDPVDQRWLRRFHGFVAELLDISRTFLAGTRSIAMESMAGALWSIDPEGTHSEDAGTETFSDLDPHADHLLQATIAGDG